MFCAIVYVYVYVLFVPRYVKVQCLPVNEQVGAKKKYIITTTAGWGVR